MPKPNREHAVKGEKNPHRQQYKSYRDCFPIWRFERFDKTHEKWGLCSKKWHKVVEELQGYEKMPWGEIESASGGRRKGTNNHFEPISGMCNEAKKRIEALKLNSRGKGIDQLFSLRITATHRLYGMLDEDGSFYVIWNDVDHEVWPVG